MLRHRDFRLLWTGQLVSSIGDQMQQIAIGWHLYLLTDSAIQVGLVGVARSIPVIALSLVGGAMADSVDRRRLLWVTNAIQIANTSVLVATTMLGVVTPHVIYAVAFIGGAASAFDAPTRQAMIPIVVPRQELANAMTLNTLLRQTSVVVGPAAGGVIIAGFGLGWTYAANALSFVAVVVAVVLMRPMPRAAATGAGAWSRIAGGWAYASRTPLVLLPILMESLRSVFLGTSVFVVVYARDVFGVGPQGLGSMRSTLAVGAVMGGILLGTGRFSARPAQTMIAGYTLEGISLLSLAIAPTFTLALLIMFVQGIGNVTAEVMRNTMVQLETPDEVRGRVASLQQIATTGLPQVGQLQAGALVTGVGPHGASGIDGLMIMSGALLFGFLSPLRQAARQRIA